MPEMSEFMEHNLTIYKLKSDESRKIKCNHQAMTWQ